MAQRSVISADKGDRFDTLRCREASLRWDDSEVMVGHYNWPDGVETELVPDRHHLSFSLSPRPCHTQGYHGGGDIHDFHDAGNMTFYLAGPLLRNPWYPVTAVAS
ncbi:MAG: hypothetical protein WDA10_09330 [Porticoccaceae bacterium]|jgi:hypothetical protein|nr:hypothetical protein [Pseudomonadota bacterium]